MTEREIPDGMGFLFGGMTDPSIPRSAPPVLSEPENGERPASSGAPVYSSRREARAAASLSAASLSAASLPVDAAAPTAAAPQLTASKAPAYDGIASLFPLLGDVTSLALTDAVAAPVLSAPVPAAPAPSAFEAILAPPPLDLGATQAIPAAEVAIELSTPVARYVVPQSAPVPIVRSWHTTDASAAFPASDLAAAPAGAGVASALDPFVTARRQHAAPANPSARQRQSSRARANDRRLARGSGRGSASRSAGRSDADGKPLRQRLFGVGVMVAVGELFAVLAIPAYADNDAATLHAAAAVQTQKVAVANAAASTVSTTARDGYSATSASDLKALYAAAMREQNIAAYLQSGAKAKGDDYPWYAELSRNQGGGLSPLGYYYRECVDFVAWRLNRDAGTTSAPFRWTWSKLTPNGGDGHQWKAAWLGHGWATGSTPVPGSVAWFGNNHVGYVNGILDNGQVLIEEYNYVPHAYGTRVINASDAYYLYAPPK